MSEKRTVYERDNDSLREQIVKLKDEHHALTHSKNRALAAARSERNAELVTLMSTFKHLRPLFAALTRAQDLADSGRSHAPDLSGNPATTRDEDPHLSSDGESTRGGRDTKTDRDRLERVDDWLAGWATKVEREMSPRRHRQTDPLGGPQCWEATCPDRSQHQALDSTVCRTCGEPFGRYVPVDFGKGPRKRCRTRGCPKESETYDGDTCPHCHGHVGNLEEPRECELDGCDETFFPSRSDARFHAPGCRLAHHRRRDRETDKRQPPNPDGA